MSKKISYAKLGLKVDSSVKTFTFQDQEVEVLKYLPIEDKYDLVMITLQKAEENGIYNDIKIDLYFHLNLVYMYSNLSFTDKQREDESKLYDCLKSNGFMDAFLATIEEDEYYYLFDAIEQIAADKVSFSTTFAGFLNNIINDLPKNAEAAAKIVDSFDPEKYQAVIDFAKAANGGRDIPKTINNVIPIKE